MMRKLLAIPATALFLSVILSGCGQNKNPEIVLETYSFNDVTQLDTVIENQKTAEYIHQRGSGVLPRALGDANIESLRDTLLKMSRVEFTKEKGYQAELTNGRRRTKLNPDSVECCGDSYSRLILMMATPEVAVWSSKTSAYNCHMAHGVYATRFLNYSLKEHRVINLSDIMKRGYEKPLLALVREKLGEYPDLLEEAKEAELPRQFYIAPEGLTFVYGLYEVAPYSAGEIEISLSYYELMELLKPSWFEMLSGIND